MFTIATLTGDQALADAQIEAARGQRGEVDMIAARAQGAAYRGRMRESERLANELFRRLQGLKRLDAAAEGFVGLAINQAIVGRLEAARADLERLRDNQMIRDGSTDEMVALGMSIGDARLAESYLDRSIQHVRKVSPPEKADGAERTTRAIAALAAGRHQEAYDLATSVGDEPTKVNALFTAGVAASRMKHWDDAARLFARVSQLRSRVGTYGLSPVVGTVSVMLGRAHAAAGRTAEARQAYEEAFDIWKDADRDLPILVEARAEYARLGS